MEYEFYCDVCNAPMKLELTIGARASGKAYRRRRFKCPICEYGRTIYAGGDIDEHNTPERAVKDLNKRLNELSKEP